MNLSKHDDAVRRYRVLIGDVKNASEVERAEAAFHREEYGEEYLPKHDFGPLKAAMLMRFMHEVRCLPFGEVYRHVVHLLREGDTLNPHGRCPATAASELVQMTGNILIAASLAVLYHNAAEGGEYEQFYQMVLEVLSDGQPVADEDASGGQTLH
jgi:hypothetical protein